MPADEGQTPEFTRDRNQLGFINEPHSFLQEVVFISEESTESSITSGNPANSSDVASTFVNKISDPIVDASMLS